MWLVSFRRWKRNGPAAFLAVLAAGPFSGIASPAAAGRDPCERRYFAVEQLAQLREKHPLAAQAFRVGNIVFFPTVEPVAMAGRILIDPSRTPGARGFVQALEKELGDPALRGRYQLYLLTVVGPYVMVEGTSLLGSGFVTSTGLKKQLPEPPGEKVYVEAIGAGDDGHGNEEAVFRKSAERDPHSHFLRVGSLGQLKEELKRIREANGPVGLLELLVHGSPGALDFPGGRVTSAELAGPPARGLFGRDAVIRLVSCQAARDLKSDPVGTRLLQSFGKTFLDQGGKVVGATRFVWGADALQAQSAEQDGAVLVKSARKYLGAFAGLPVASLRVPFQAVRDFPKFLQWLQSEKQPPFRIVEIPPEP